MTGARLTRKQGQIAAFVGAYGPSAHRMILRLEAAGVLARIPGQPRTIQILPTRQEIPDLEWQLIKSILSNRLRVQVKGLRSSDGRCTGASMPKPTTWGEGADATSGRPGDYPVTL